MLSKFKIKTKMILALCSVILFMYGMTIFLVMRSANSIIKEETIKKTNYLAWHYRGMVKSRMEKAIQTARTIAHNYEAMISSGIRPDKTQLDQTLQRIMEKNPDFSGIWVMIDPGKLFETHYYPWLHRQGEKIEFAPVETIKEYKEETEQPYFTIPKQNRKASLLEPYMEPDINIMMTSAVVPVIVDNQFAGVAGVDLTLETLTKMMASIKPYDTGKANLLSNSGIYIAHPDTSMLNKPLETTSPLLKEAVTAIKKGENFHATYPLKVSGKDIYRIFVPIHVGDKNAAWSFSMEIPMEKVLEEGKKILWICIVTGLVSLLIAGGIISLIALSITRSINHTVSRLKDIAQGEGDLTMRLPVSSKDELGQLATWFNVFMEKLQAIIVQVSHNTHEVDVASNDLSVIAAEFAVLADSSSSRVNDIAESTEELNTDMTTVAAAMEQSTTNASMVASASEQMSTTIGQIAKNVEEAFQISGTAVTQAEETSQRMNELAEVAQSISRVTETITDISDKTNLLALNATIEAARAGEAGKGFAVVATEIKDLAAQTAEATNDIKNQVGAIQDSSKVSIGAIDEIVTIINQVNDIISTINTAVDEQSSATQEIASNISQANEGFIEINENINHSSAISGEITQRLAQSSSAAGQISEKSQAVTSQAARLQELATGLKEIVNSFKI